MDSGRLVVAEIVRPRGVRGELVARSLTDIPGRLEKLKLASLHLPSGADVPIEIERAWQHKEHWVLKFAGIDSLDTAERFRGADLWIPPEERGELPGNDFFQSDLVGCAVFDGKTGQALGQVEGFREFGGPTLLALTVKGREVLIPFVPALCKVDLAARVVQVDAPEGLFEL